MDRQTALEERMAHLERTIGDLSEVVARHADEIDRLGRVVEVLLEREAEREAAAAGVPPPERPPHW